MLTVETVSRIRREHFVKGKTIREISRDLKVSRNTVRKVLRSGEIAFEYERNVQPRRKLGRWTTELDELLEGNTTKPFREQLTLIFGILQRRDDGLRCEAVADGIASGMPLAFFGDRTGAFVGIPAVGLDLPEVGH